MCETGRIERRVRKLAELTFELNAAAAAVEEIPFSAARIPNDRDAARLLLAVRPAANPDEVGV